MRTLNVYRMPYPRTKLARTLSKLSWAELMNAWDSTDSKATRIACDREAVARAEAGDEEALCAFYSLDPVKLAEWKAHCAKRTEAQNRAYRIV